MALMGMETDSASFPNSSTSSTAKWKYDVFLSFKGDDTRNNFMSHLHEALIQKGITTFKDDVKLERGESISQELSKAIEESRFAIVILSENYASSTWCLEELAKIIGCKKEKGMTILPIFHYVDPSDIRKQKGTFEQAFIKHEEKGNKESVEKWRNALREVGNLAGWHLKNTRPEMEDIKDIVGKISLNMKYDAIPYMTKNLVGIYSRMTEFESCLAIDSNDVLFIGIRGMGGIGKTTLARVVYYMVSKKFESCSFIENVRENSEKDGLLSLQQKLISDILNEKNIEIRNENDAVLKIMNRFPQKKILLVLDDVNKSKQLQMLAEKHDWFGPGSRIIITSRDVEVLNTHGVDDVYEVEGLEDDDALQLFCLKAFKKENVPNDYLELSKDFLKHANGHPLALEVLGSLLFGKNTNEWESALQRLKEFPNAKVLRVLRISFDTLQETEKEIFLHIACFFNHNMKDRVVERLDILHLYPIIGLRKLIDMSLLKITANGQLWMHDLLEEMGRNIVRQEFPNDPGKHSRLWRYQEIDNMLEKNKGTEVVQAMDIRGDFRTKEAAHWNPKAFLKMHNLKFLRIGYIYHVPPHLPKDLKILEWYGYPAKSLPSSFQQNELTQLCLISSNIEQLWVGRKNFNKLKFINLAYSLSLTITPDFTGVPHLEKLVLEDCKNLCELHPSIGILKKLVFLNLAHCINLSSLPSKLEMDSLQNLDLSYCSKLQKIPKSVGNLVCLQNLFLDHTPIVELPSSIERLMHLTSLTLFNCNKLVSLPNTTCGFKFHGALDLSTCLRFKNLPENPWIIEGIEELDLSKAAIEEMPSSIGSLTNLTRLTLRFCMNLVHLPSIICSLKSLESLDLYGCSNLKNLPENLGNIKSLQKLDLSGTTIQELPSSIERLMHLTSLTLFNCYKLVSLPNTTCGFKFHGALDLSTCLRFKNLPENPWIIEGLEKLTLSGTAIEEMPSSIGCLTNLTRLTLRFCMNLVHLPSIICSLKLLNSLDLFGCLKLETLPENIRNMKGLEELNLCWTSIKEVPSSIVLLKNLKILYISRWKLSEFYSQPAGLESMDPLWNLLLPQPTSPLECIGLAPFLYYSLPTSPLECIGLPSYLYYSLPTSPVLEGLLFSSLTGLHSLTHLHINDCDLLLIPDDIGCLSSLRCLNLSGNNFVSLPESMSQLFNLQSLYLEGCKRLQSFGNVPSTINSVIANDCSSLERLPELQFYPFRSNYSRFQCFNCFKLVDCIQNGSNMLQGLPNIVIPGGEIPKWFSHECRGDSMQLSFHGFDELIGIALCVVFVPNGSRQDHIYQDFKCNFWLNGLYIADFAQPYYFRTKYGRVKSPHFWLLYLPSHHFISNWGKIRSCIDAYGFSQLKIKIDAEVVEKIGVQLVYKQDMEDPNQTMAQCINNNSTLYVDLGVLHQDIDDSTVESSRNKQSCDVDDGAGPSGEGYSNEEPQPKWIQREFFDFFAREDEMPKKLESIRGGKSDCYQDIEGPNQIITQLCISSRTLYEDLGDRHHDLYNSAAEVSRIKLSRDEEDGAGPSEEGYSSKEPELKWIQRVGEFMADDEDSSQREIIDFFAIEGEDQTTKKLESILGGKRDSYQDIEDPNQTITQLSIKSRTPYEDLGDRHHDLYDSTLEGSRNKRSHDEGGRAGPSGEGCSSDQPPSKGLEDVWLILKNFVQGMFRLFCLRESKKLEAYCSGKREGYRSDGEELAAEGPSSQTHVGTG